MRTLLISAAGALLLAGSVQAQTLLLRYTYDDGVGNSPALDSGALPLAPGTFEGSATRSSNTPGGASLASLDLTGAAPKYLNAGDVDKIDGLSQFTLTSWVNLQAAPANGNRIMAKQVPSGNFDGFSFAFSNPTQGTIAADNFQLNLATGGTGGFVFSTSGADMGAANEWAFVAVTYDGTQTTGNLKFYTGDESAMVAQLGPTRDVIAGPMVAHANDFRVGAQSASTASATVLFDDTRVYSGLLSPAELEAVRLSNVPEPASLALLASTGLLLRRRR